MSRQEERYILLIESDPILGATYKKIIESTKYQVIWEVDPQKAIEYADERKPFRIVCGMFVGDKTGVEFVYEFKSYEDWRNIPIILFNQYQDVHNIIDKKQQKILDVSMVYVPSITTQNISRKLLL